MKSLSPTEFGRTQRPNEAWLAKALEENVIEPDLPIIDTHMHLWHHATGYRYFVEQFAEDIANSGHNVVASLFTECKSMYRATGPEHLKPVGETEFAVGMAAIAASAKYTTCKVAHGIVANADPMMGEAVAEVLDAHIEAANGRLKGVRQRAKWDPDPAVKGAVSADGPGLYLEPIFHKGLKEVQARNLVFEASIYHPQIPDVTAMAKAVPDLNIVLIHTGNPVGHSRFAGQEKTVFQDWYRSMTELAECPNVSIKLGGLLMTLANFDFGVADRPPTSEELAPLWQPYLDASLELFGSQRCMVSSNFPVDKAGFTYRALWNMYKRVFARCSPTEKSALFSDNATRIYQL